MDASEYLKRRGRMCESIDECIYCPIYLTAMEGGASMHLRDLWEVNDCHFWEQDNSEQAEQAVEEWSKEHDPCTNAMKFEEVFGMLPSDCVAPISWWDEPYKEPEHE